LSIKNSLYDRVGFGREGRLGRTEGAERQARFAAELDQTAFFSRLNLYHKPPDSGERQHKSRA